MDLLQITAVLITLTGVFSFLNHVYLKLPATIGVMAISMALSLMLLILGSMGFPLLLEQEKTLLSGIDFSTTLLHGMLSFLLFAGALHVDLNRLSEMKWIVASLATIGVLLSTLIVALLVWSISLLLDLPLSFIHSLLFGALISPTDPVAVISTLKTLGVPASLKTKIAGESLFNDGVGVVLFLVIFNIAYSSEPMQATEVAELFITETFGGALFGLLAGYITYRMLRLVDNYQVEIILSLALVMGGYAFAEAWHLSAPIAIVVAGLLIGNHGRQFAMSETTREHLDTFWELIDEILNAVLFVLLGLEILLIIPLSASAFLLAIIAIPIVLLSRFISVSIPVSILRSKYRFTPGVIKILTWGGLRGGISVALVLSLPADEVRLYLLPMTYAVVVFAMLVQGLTLGRMVRKQFGT
ncbi:MAG TPA: sodium:proton antiporter [Gammaproteobacteria bacterium]|nr:Na(+)/H(+) antiporter NhaP [bacterium BMS3Abin11]GMT41410.1 MAG: sodium:proton antiporter [bacterium]HDH15274.1 sodium:proton antiporter [Gammaproteobacteria bacterium]HDZ78455.1 sodium:proton antiporter [Gammaproteobacteria bacterium]